MARAITSAGSHVSGWRLPSFRGNLAILLALSTLLVVLAALALAVADGEFGNDVPALAIVGFSLVGGVVVNRRPGILTGWLLLVIGFSMAMLMGSLEYAHHALEVEQGRVVGGNAAAWLSGWFPLVTNGLLVAVLPQVYPDGRVIGPRWRFALWAGVAFIVLAALGNAFVQQHIEGLDNRPNPYAIESLDPLFSLCIMLSLPAGGVAVVAGFGGLIVRWRRSFGDERQQIKWFAAGIAPAAFGALVVHSVNATAGNIFITLALPILPVCLGVAILRYRLYELDLLLNRALVYTLLSAGVVAIYSALVLGAEQLTGNGHSLPVQGIATLGAAAAFHPLRMQAQRLVDRLFYGERARPYEVLARLGQSLELAPLPDSVLGTIVDSVAEALRLPAVGIEFREGPAWVVAARYGSPGPGAAAFPMVYQGETVGRLLAEPRARGEPFSGADVRLLRDLARSAGVAAHAVRVSVDLRRSRAALVTAREEERRRLRRDLHDGLGPTLAGVTLGLHAARETLSRGLDGTEALLAGLESQVEDAVRDIRRLVYGLRPPALDEVGLVRALRQQAEHLEGGASGLTVMVVATPPTMADLPAAVEVAAYRIATEAMLNTSRHANARLCKVQIERNEALEVQVTDDGIGLPAEAHPGVGLSSMRERAMELGGQFEMASSTAGTVVRAVLPLGNDRG